MLFIQEEHLESHESQVFALTFAKNPVAHVPTQLTPLKYPILQLKQFKEFVQVLQGALQGTHELDEL